MSDFLVFSTRLMKGGNMRMGKLLLAIFCTVALAGSYACTRTTETAETAMQETQPTTDEAVPTEAGTPEEGTTGETTQGE